MLCEQLAGTPVRRSDMRHRPDDRHDEGNGDVVDGDYHDSWLAFQWVRVSWVIKVDHQVGHLLDARYGWKSVGQYLRQLTVDQLTDLYQCVQL